tara:strand:- start:727 stop:1104 length:378 start_codon:yes stop_codon:yes gene_type:complete
MNLTEQAIADAAFITSNGNDFGVECVFVSPLSVTATVNVLHTKHNTGYDADTGERINTKIASIAVSEVVLNAANYPTRDGTGECTLKNHRVSLADSTGIVKEYKVSENYPDEKLGLIVLILIDFE